MLGDQCVLVCLFEWLTLLPDITPLPQLSQYFAIQHTSFRYVSYNFNAGVPYVSVTNNGMTFNKAVVIKLGYPRHVVLLVDAEGKRVAVQACDDTTPNSVAFYKEKKSNVISVRWNGRDLLNTIQEITGWDLKQSGGYRVDGVPLKDENAILFDLKEAKPLS